MPARGPRNKKSRSQIRDSATRAASTPRSIAELLARSRTPGLKGRAPQPFDWVDFLRQALKDELGPEVAPRISSAELRQGGVLVVFADSAAWCARLRFTLADAAPALVARKPEILRIEVRTAPGSA